MLRAFAFFTILCTACPCFAGGSFEPVRVTSLEIKGADYTLVVVPVNVKGGPGQDPYMGNCKTFKVNGTYDWAWWLTRTGISDGKKSHRRALMRLKQAYDSKTRLYFGWMGSGFKIVDKNNPCVVESKGLDLIEDAVISFYESV